jgi:pheromone shutdown protein TraB
LLDPDANKNQENDIDEKNLPSHGMTATSQKMSVLFTKIQADYAKKLNVTIGGEFRSAFQSALTQQKKFWNQQQYLRSHTEGQIQCLNLNHPCAIILGDRPVRITLSRAWESLGFFGKIKLVLCLIWSSIWQPSEKEIKEWMESILNDRTGKNDLMTKAMEEMGKAFPSIKRVIIEERDDFMTAKLRQCAEMLMQMKDEKPNRVIVAVVGAGHCTGMLNKLLDRTRDDGLILKNLVETKKRKLNNDEEIMSLVTDVVQFDYDYVLQCESL